MGTASQRSLTTFSASPDTPPPEHMGPYVPSNAAKASEDRLWTSHAPVSPPMTNYAPSTRTDMSSRTTNESYPKPRDDSAAAAIQRLPSLNSLFGRPPSQIRPLHAPSPLAGPSRSPLDRPTSTTSSQRSLSTSYFPSTVAPGSNYAASTRSDHERHSSGLLHFPGPLSPGRPRESVSSHHESRYDSIPSTRWSYSSQSEGRRPDYVLSASDAPSSYRPGTDRPPYPPRMGYEASSISYREQSQAQPSQQQNERITASLEAGASAVSEGLPVKDGLGPKIWTGTHFLPRFLRQSEVPGEGLCYFYDDGTHCKAIIDGEQVNAHWGVTKAGKPRKRLAIACLTCREKKIKCDPDFPRCVQCEKFGRVCRFKNAPRGGHNTSPGASPAREAEDSRQSTQMHQQLDETRRHRSDSLESVSPKTSSLKRAASSAHLVEPYPSKRVVLDYERYPPLSGQAPSPRAKDQDLSRTALPWHDQTRAESRVNPSQELPRLVDDIRRRPWQQ